MPLDAIFGTTIEALGKGIDLRAKKHNHISANLANVETPGYRPTNLSFEGELKDALKGKKSPAMTHPRHIPLKGTAVSLQKVEGTVVDTSNATTGRDGNAVELEQEMSRMAENQIMYNASIQMLAKKFEGIKQAIKGGM